MDLNWSFKKNPLSLKFYELIKFTLIWTGFSKIAHNQGLTIINFDSHQRIFKCSSISLINIKVA